MNEKYTLSWSWVFYLFVPPFLDEHSKNKNPVLGNVIPLFGMKQNEAGTFLVIFQDRPMFSPIIQKVSARAFH